MSAKAACSISGSSSKAGKRRHPTHHRTRWADMSDHAIKRRIAALIGAALLAVATATHAAWPDKPVRLMVGFAPGGSDIGGRIIAQKLSEMWGQPVIVDNRPGAAGNIAADLVAKSPP